MPFQEALSPEMIIAAYRGGYFPMPDPESGEMLWFNPDPRAIIPLDRFHISRSLRKTQRKMQYGITFDQDFRGVIQKCAARQTTWITPAIKKAYTRLFEMGVCHSVEIWNHADDLVGGLYGVSLGGVFNAESMFSREPDTSKIALWALIQRMVDSGLVLLEVQFMTEHLRTLGATEISRSDYLARLDAAIHMGVHFTPPTGEFFLSI